MSPEENKALVRRYYEEIDAGNLAAMDELVAEDFVNHSGFPFPGITPDRDGLKKAFEILWKATPGRHEIEDQVAEGDKVVTRLSAHGRFEEDLPGPIPATGNEVHMTAVAIHRIADGKIAEHWSDKDELGLMIQIGVIEPPGQPG
jgi:predicted ester cyclase